MIALLKNWKVIAGFAVLVALVSGIYFANQHYVSVIEEKTQLEQKVKEQTATIEGYEEAARMREAARRIQERNQAVLDEQERQTDDDERQAIDNFSEPDEEIISPEELELLNSIGRKR